MSERDTPNHDLLHEILLEEEFEGIHCLVMEEFDDALLGYYFAESEEDGRYARAVYSRELIIDCLVAQSDFMDEPAAEEYFEYNIMRSVIYTPKTPLIIEDIMYRRTLYVVTENPVETAAGDHPCDPTKGDHCCDS